MSSFTPEWKDGAPSEPGDYYLLVRDGSNTRLCLAEVRTERADAGQFDYLYVNLAASNRLFVTKDLGEGHFYTTKDGRRIRSTWTLEIMRHALVCVPWEALA